MQVGWPYPLSDVTLVPFLHLHYDSNSVLDRWQIEFATVRAPCAVRFSYLCLAMCVRCEYSLDF